MEPDRGAARAVVLLATGGAKTEPEIAADEQLGDRFAADVDHDRDLPREHVRHFEVLLDLTQRHGITRADVHLKARAWRWRLRQCHARESQQSNRPRYSSP